MAWTIEVSVREALPPMAWVMRARPPFASVVCGGSVRRFESGVFEGTWVGEAETEGILGSTTTFGSGVFVDRDSLRLVPPSHMLEAIYLCRRGADVFAANSFAALLRAAGLELRQRWSVEVIKPRYAAIDATPGEPTQSIDD